MLVSNFLDAQLYQPSYQMFEDTNRVLFQVTASSALVMMGPFDSGRNLYLESG